MDLDTDDIDAQIAALQAAKERKIAAARREQERKEKESAKVLVGLTPKKDKRANELPPSPPRQPIFGGASSSRNASVSTTPATAAHPAGGRPRPVKQELPSLHVAGPSRMSSSLMAMRRSGVNASSSSRTVGMGSRSDGDDLEIGPQSENEGNRSTKTERDEDTLAIIEKLQPGPKDFGLDPDGESGWESVEPNSRIRLSKRILAHSTLQDHLFGRYYLPPSLLYSVIRLSRDGATYDVPVDGDWLTIAVVAERGEVRVSGTRDAGPDSGSESEEDENTTEDSKAAARDRARKQLEADTSVPKLTADPRTGGQPWKPWYKKDAKKQPKRRPRKYINLRLAAMPPRSHITAGSGGDALLQLLLFEADSVSRSEPDEEGNVEKRYKGGSGGAYEKWCNLNPGDVIGIISPKILRPLKAGSGAPHPLTLPLALNPNTADSIFIIGQSRDLGRCNATQKDGNRCSTWVDSRQGAVCEYHVHLAIQRSRSGRAEFTASTSSFALSSHPNQSGPGPGSSRGGRGGKVGIDHRNKTGLLPAAGPQAAPRGADNGGGGVTYVVGGGVVRANGSEGLKGWGEEHLSEKLGRSRADKRKRRLEEKEAEEALSRMMMQKEGVGGKYLVAAANHRRADDEMGKNGKRAQNDAAMRRKADTEKIQDVALNVGKKPFSAQSIKRIGFDPTNLLAQPRLCGQEEKKREMAIASLKTSGKVFDPRAKVKMANVRAPPGGEGGSGSGVGSRGARKEDHVELSDGDGDNGRRMGGEDEGMIDLD